MSSCKWEDGKLHGATEAKARLRHCEITVEFRAIAKKKNKHIDLSKCKYNFTRYGRSYAECCRLYDAKIAALDALPKQNRKANRVTMCCVEVPAPKDLPPEKIKEWFTRLGDIFEKRYGRECILEIFVHVDEVHSYDHCETGEETESRIHAHICFIPVKKDKLNAKELSLQKNMKSLNREVDKFTVEEFHCKFMDGSKKRSFKTVEQMKEESANKQIEREKKEAEKVIAEAESKRQAEAERKQRLDDQAARLMKWRNDLQDQESDLENRRAVLVVDEKNLADKWDEYNAAVSDLETDRAAVKADADKNKADAKELLKKRNTQSKKEDDFKAVIKAYNGLIDLKKWIDAGLKQYEKKAAANGRPDAAAAVAKRRQDADAYMQTVDEYKRQNGLMGTAYTM